MQLRILALAVLSAAPLACTRPRSTPSAAASAEARPAPPPAESASAPELEAALHVPALAAGQKAPLLIMLHGLGASAREIEAGSSWLEFANEHRIAWLAPDGPLDQHGRRFWDAGPSCCNFDRLPVDHVAALAALIERTVATPSIDRSRVFVGGHSNGAFMAHRLACERPDLVRGIIALAGTGPLDPARCRSPETLNVLQIHGDADPIVPYAGGHLFRNPSLPQHLSAPDTARNWASLLGCEQAPRPLAPVDLEASIRGPETQVQSYPNCKRGRVELWTVTGGSHLIGFRSPAPAAIWAFMSQ